ncbi:MAG: glutamine synthetase family protein [Actinomycetota bacterium]
MGDELARAIADHGVRTVRLMANMPDGRLVGKYIAATHLAEMLPSLPNVADVTFGLDVDNEPNVMTPSTWRGNLAELYLQPDVSTLVVDPRLPDLASVLCCFVLADGTAIPECPRGMVIRLLDELTDRGFAMRAGFEVEFNAFEESIAVARRRGYRGLTPLGGHPNSAYSVTKSLPAVRFMDAVTRRLDDLGIHWESWLDEGGAGQFELNLEPDDALRTADNITRTRLALREVAEEQGHCVTFMAKWHPDQWGGGLHLNHSLWRDTESAFFDPTAPDNRSDTYRNWIGGLVATMRGATALAQPNINSYRRFVELAGSPTTVTWSGDNKTTSMRAMAQSAGSARAELRTPGSDANHYLVMAAALAGGISGLDERLEPPPPFEGSAWGLPPEDGLQLPNSIRRASAALDTDDRLRARFGDAFVDYWIGMLEWEWLSFHTTGGDPDLELTEWELNRYFERV